MVEMPVGHQDLRHACQCGLVLRVVQHRIAGEPGVDQQNLILDLDAKAAVA